MHPRRVSQCYALPSAALVVLLTLALDTAAATPGGGERPNFLVIVADDLGFSDLGVFGGEIRTPNLDALALSGVRLTGLHTAPTCSPTRAMLLTGNDNHQVGLGSMAEAFTPEQRGQPGYEGFLTRRAATVAERLHEAGYRTYMAGKWHLGLEEEQSPAARGFDRYFALLQGVHNHYGIDQDAAYRCRASLRAIARTDGSRVPARGLRTILLSGLLAISRKASMIAEPFFAYFTFTQPHWPLQAPGGDGRSLSRSLRCRPRGAAPGAVEAPEPVGLDRTGRRALCARWRLGLGELASRTARYRVAQDWKCTRPWSSAWTRASAGCCASCAIWANCETQLSSSSPTMAPKRAGSRHRASVTLYFSRDCSWTTVSATSVAPTPGSPTGLNGRRLLPHLRACSKGYHHRRRHAGGGLCCWRRRAGPWPGFGRVPACH